MSLALARLVVLGAGGIGAGIGGLLAAAGLPVRLVARGDHGRAMLRDGLRLRGPGWERHLELDVGSLGEVRADELVVLATMAQDAEAAIAALPPARKIVSFGNSPATEQMLQERGHSVLGAVVYVPATRLAPGVVDLHGSPVPGAILVGAWPGGADPVAGWLVGWLNRAGLRAREVPDVRLWKLSKLETNLGGIVQALCAEACPDLVAALGTEARACYAAAGLAVPTVGALMEAVGPLSLAPVGGLPRDGGSTWQALQRGQELETRLLNGEIVRMAERQGGSAPLNSALVTLASRAVREGWRPGALTREQLRVLMGVA